MSPSLTAEEQARMLGGEHTCSACGATLTKNYCRQCDEFFYEGHAPGCPHMADRNSRDDHRGHRTY